MWMEHSLSPKVQGDVSAWFGAVPSVPAACKGNALLTDEGCATNGYRRFRQDQVLDDADRQMRQPERVRALLPLGVRLYRGDRRTVRRCHLPFCGEAGLRRSAADGQGGFVGSPTSWRPTATLRVRSQ